MKHFDVFNGDADGICALHQLRLAAPRDSELVTGVKRDIDLLKRVEAGEGDCVTVLDISLDKNREALERLLDRGANVLYFDHHFPGGVPEHANLDATIDTAAGVCTSLLVDDYLEGRYRAWAIAAAFGDNLDDVARDVANDAGLTTVRQTQLRELGIYINYNAYG
ncbi:MAG: acetyltransferase, partial [Gammaproteobacteria bacterium]